MPSNRSRFIGITMGCPVGIGPEIILKYLGNSANDLSGFQPVVIGDPQVFARCAAELGPDIEIIPWQPGEAQDRRGLYLYHPPGLQGADALDGSALTWGAPDARTGKAMAVCIESCRELISRGELAAMVTCPITKSALKMAGYHYPGHTEMLASLCAAPEYAMMMAGQDLRVTLVTIHVPLQKVAALLTVDAIVRLIDLTGRALRDDFAISSPRMAVAGFNPHAGEDGLFGNEEIRVIAPAVARARELGWNAVGPFPPDTVFSRATAGDFDAVVCMYHDQGLIPFKLLHFADGVNVTIGLPMVRTSVDHGTAYDIAGKGIASAASLAAAYRMAAEIVGNRSKEQC